MERVKLGRTGIEVSRLCIGCWQAAGWASTDEDRFVTTVRHALDRGVNFLDTAPAYGGGRSEELVGRAIQGRRDKVVVATKFSASKSEDVRPSVEKSLKFLNTDYIDLLQQHWPAPGFRPEAALTELEKLKQEGKIKAIGVSNWMEPEWDEVKDPARVYTLQPCHNFLWRSIEKKVLPLCRQHNIAVLPYSPLCQGALTGRFRKLEDLPNDIRRKNKRLQPDVFPKVLELVSALGETAAKYGKTIGQTALRWLLDQEGITSVIVGASRPEQVDQNLGALDWKMDSADWKRLADLSWPLSADLNPYDTLWGWHPMKK